MAKNKRGPTVLVTDTREVPWRQPVRPSTFQRAGKLISVENVLQYASDIPSAQRRAPFETKKPGHTRTPSGRHPLDPKLSGRLAPQHMPMRSTKVSEKLVLIPDTSEEEAAAKKGEYARDNDDEPLRTEEEEERRRHQRRMSGEGDDGDGYGDERMRNKSYAERLPKSRRTEKVARVTAYCTAQAYKLRATADFVKTKHRARTKLYDDCLYTVYHLPLLKGVSGLQVRSSLSLKVPGGKSMLDEEIEWNEQFGYRDQHSDDGHYGVNQFTGMDGNELWEHQNSGHYEEPHTLNANGEGQQHRVLTSINDINKQSSSPTQISSNTVQVGELYIFSYGVIVFWNFSERQEKDILADLTFSAVGTCFSLVTRPQRDEDFETEEFHFEYDPDTPRPRIYNDMITLRSGDHMIKLAMSHAIAQSTKLSFFEERMARTMQEAQHVPRRLALTGKLGMKREEVVGILGRLYMSRVDVNLSSNMLDTPNFFWDSEPTLHPLYDAVREYLEIKSRIQVLNERCRVFLDLAEILSDAIADKKMTYITWIIIGLIVVSIIVTCSEVFLRFGLLSSRHRKSGLEVQSSGLPMLSVGSGLGCESDAVVHELL